MCTLNEDDVCLGCGRLLKEITSWTTYSNEQREVLLMLCEERKKALSERSLCLKETE
jgi:predicted Fe-S protein YdhL (DUF1289 family)